MGHIQNRLIAGARSAWYGVYEKARLHAERIEHDDKAFWTTAIDPLVSVLIPTFNRVGLLFTRALPSVLNQTYTNLDTIVADHGSTDTTASLTYDTGKSLVTVSDPRVRVIHVPRRRTYPPTAENHWLAGPVDPLNAALTAARGAWLARIDDDDEWTPDHVEKLLRFAQAGNYEFVSSAYETHEKVVRHDGGIPPIGGVQTWLMRSYLRFFRYNRDCWRKKWNRVNDTDVAQRLRNAGVRIGHLDSVTAFVLPRPNESQVGLKAYLNDRKGVERRLEFT